MSVQLSLQYVSEHSSNLRTRNIYNRMLLFHSVTVNREQISCLIHAIDINRNDIITELTPCVIFWLEQCGDNKKIIMILRSAFNCVKQ